MKRPPLEFEEMLTPGQVAAMFGVTAKSVRRWANDGRLAAVKTPGGHHRVKAVEAQRLLALRNPPADGAA